MNRFQAGEVANTQEQRRCNATKKQSKHCSSRINHLLGNAMQKNHSAKMNTNSSSETDTQEILSKGIGAAIALFLLMVLLGAAVVQFSEYLPKSIRGVKKLGEIGDYLGGILNPVVALMALFALFRSIEIQRTELKATNAALDRQGQVQNRDRAERIFFELLSLRSNIVASIEWIAPDSNTSKGRAAIKAILKEVEEMGKKHADVDLNEDLTRWEVPTELASHVQPYVAVFAYRYSGIAYSKALETHKTNHTAWANYEPELGHVFRATFQILKFIHKQALFSPQEKEDFTNYLRAQMSEDEFVLFALTSLTSIGKKSREAAIVLDFFENRLQSTPWAKDMCVLFANNEPKTRAMAESEVVASAEY